MKEVDYNKVPDPTLEENLCSENGRRVFLIQKLVNQVDYLNNGNLVRIKF